MLALHRWTKKTQLPPYLLAGLAMFIIGYFALLSPSSLEEDFTGVRIVHPKDLLNFLKNEAEPILAVGVPTQVTPTYSLRNSDIYSSTENRPQLKFSSKKANFYQKEQFVHAKEPIVTLPHNTIISGKEALQNLNTDVIEFFGDVVVTFENGLIVRSNYIKAVMKPVLTISIPVTEAVAGERKDKRSQLNFKSYGFNFVDQEPREAHLLSQVTTTLIGEHTTQVQSDQSKLNLTTNKLYFFMNEDKSLDRRFVLTHQKTLELKSLVMEMDFKNSQLNTITAITDVSVRDKTFYATCGKAVFIEHTNQIQMSEFPQVYQDSDTITGDVIVYNRSDDTIEVKQSNAIYNKH